MKGRVVCTTKRDGVLASLTVAGTRAELSVVDLTTGAPDGSVVFPVVAAGALIWTLQSVYDMAAENAVAKSTSEKTETKKRAKKRSKKE